MPGAIPTPLLKWAKVLVRAGGEVAVYLVSKIDFQADTTPEALAWRRLQVVFSRTTPAGTVEDRAVCTFDFLNVTGGAVDTSWTTGDYTTIEGFMDTFWNTVRTFQANTHTLVEYRWYAMAFRPMLEAKPFAPSLFPERVTSRSLAGTGTSPLPYQVAMSVTEKTALPKHWGRFYIPGINGSLMTTNGRWLMVGGANNIAAAADTLYEACAGAELFPVVPITQVEKVPVRGLLGVTQLQVDDIPDVVRRRRPKQAAVRTLSTP